MLARTPKDDHLISMNRASSVGRPIEVMNPTTVQRPETDGADVRRLVRTRKCRTDCEKIMFYVVSCKDTRNDSIMARRDCVRLSFSLRSDSFLNTPNVITSETACKSLLACRMSQTGGRAEVHST
jgi:hypothetical protein